METKDKLTETIQGIINNSNEPLETKEVKAKMPEGTRTKILYRLRELRAEGLIEGKRVGASRGSWIWWKKDAFKGEG